MLGFFQDGFSCSDSEDEDVCPVEEIRSEEEEVVAGGLVRIEFRAGNTAEAIEDEAENTRRVETLAREKAEEEAMLENIPWEWSDVTNVIYRLFFLLCLRKQLAQHFSSAVARQGRKGRLPLPKKLSILFYLRKEG